MRVYSATQNAFFETDQDGRYLFPSTIVERSAPNAADRSIPGKPEAPAFQLRIPKLTTRGAPLATRSAVQDRAVEIAADTGGNYHLETENDAWTNWDGSQKPEPPPPPAIPEKYRAGVIGGPRNSMGSPTITLGNSGIAHKPTPKEEATGIFKGIAEGHKANYQR